MRLTLSSRRRPGQGSVAAVAFQSIGQFSWLDVVFPSTASPVVCFVRTLRFLSLSASINLHCDGVSVKHLVWDFFCHTCIATWTSSPGWQRRFDYVHEMRCLEPSNGSRNAFWAWHKGAFKLTHFAGHTKVAISLLYCDIHKA